MSQVILQRMVRARWIGFIAASGLLGCSVGTTGNPGGGLGLGGSFGPTAGQGDTDGDDFGDDDDDPDDDDGMGDTDGGDSDGGGSGGDPGSATNADPTAGPDSTTGAGDDDSDDDPTADPPPIPDAGEPEDCGDDVDVVFVMDVSTSMGPFLDTLADEILAVDAALQAFNLASDPHYGLVVFVDDVLVLGGGAPYPSANALRDDFIQWSNFTASNLQIGGGGNYNTTWPENSLDGLWAASQSFGWRPKETTTRIIIHTTDDTFWDGPTVGNAVPIVHGYAQTQAELQSEEIRVYSFAAEIGGECECLDVSMGWFDPYEGHPPMGDGTNGGVYDIDAVLSGAISLSEAIPGAVEESICDPYF